MVHSLAVLSTALLFGGMVLYAFGFAAFVFKTLPPQTAGSTLRQAFPWFYAFVIATAALAAVLWWFQDATSAAVIRPTLSRAAPVKALCVRNPT